MVNYTHVIFIKPNQTLRSKDIPDLGETGDVVLVQVGDDGAERVKFINNLDIAKKEALLGKKKGTTAFAVGDEYNYEADYIKVAANDFVFHNCPDPEQLKKNLKGLADLLIPGDITEEVDTTALDEALKSVDEGKARGPVVDRANKFVYAREGGVTGRSEEGKEEEEDIPADTTPTVPAPAPTVPAPATTAPATAPAAAAPTAPAPTIEDLDRFAYSEDYNTMTDPTDVTNIIKSVITLDHATKYSGFSAKKVRMNFINSCPSANEYARDLILLLMGFVRIANNVGKIQKKRENSKQAKKIQDLYSDKKFKTKAMTAEELTLPRLAIAFMPELLMVRTFLITDIQNQFETGLETRFADLQLAGSADIYSRPGYADFYKQMSAAIHKVAGKQNARSATDKYGVDPNDAKFQENLKRWLKVAQDGFSKDQAIVKNRLTAAISFRAPETNKKRAAFEWIRTGYEQYRV